MNYLGIDGGRKTSHICGTDSKGKALRLERKVVDNTLAGWKSLVKQAKGKSGVTVAIETGNCTFIWARAMRDAGASVYVVDPYQNALIRESSKKTDAKDAKQLCTQLRKEQLPEIGVYVPTEEEEDMRRLVSARADIVKRRTALSNRAVRLCDRHGLYLENGVLGYAKAWRALAEDARGWPEIDQFFIRQHHEEFVLLDRQLKEIEELLEARRKRDFNAAAELIRSIPGLGPVTTNALVGLAGNWKRFPSSREFQRYLGLTPIRRQSGKKDPAGSICKKGNSLVRGYMVNAAEAFTKNAAPDDPLKLWYEETKRRRTWYKARIGLARKLAGIIYGMVKHGKPYDPSMNRTTRDNLFMVN